MKMMKSINQICILSLILLSVCPAKADKEEPLDLIHADKLLSSGKEADNRTNLIGNVHLRHGSTDLWADRAVWYRETNLVVFIDSVRVVDSSRVITCQTLTYYRNSGSATAVGDVVVEDKDEQVLLQANKVDYIRDEDKFIATGGPEFILCPDDDSSKTVITGDSLIYGAGSKTGEVLGDVVITRRNVESVSDKAVFYDSGEIIDLLGEPKVNQDQNLLEGDQITMLTQDRTLDGMVVEGKAKATYRDREDSLDSDYTEAILEGKQLEVFFINDEINRAVMRSNAMSFYFPSKSDTLASGKNVASGDSITLYFDDGEIYRVLILGGAEGHYEERKQNEKGEAVPETTYYDAHEIDYLVKENFIRLIDNSRLRYQNMSLKSGMIQYDIKNEILIAQGLKVQSDSGEVLEQTPVISEGAEELYGRRMTYNIGTRRGKVELGETEYDNAFFLGDELRQVDENIIYVRSGKYIPCEDKEGGVHFYSHKMKMIGKDKVIAKPVVLFVGPLPVFAIPYYVFPIRKGRTSGFLTFQLGNFERGERFIRNVGYYWAASEYWDAQASMDYYENTRTIINGRLRYNLRYVLDGSLSGSFTRRTSWSNYERNVGLDWRFGFSHNQKLSESMSLNGSGTFLSSKTYNIDNSYDQDDRLNRSINSKMSLTKRWRSDYLQSLIIAVDQNWNLDTDTKTRHLPVIKFSSANIQVFRKRTEDKTVRVLPWEEDEEDDADHWYHSIKFRINSDFDDFQKYVEKDSVLDWRKYKTLQSNMNLSMNPKLFSVLSVSPSINVQQTFYKIDEIHQADSVNLKTDDIFRREVWSARLSLSTTLYGTVYPNVFKILGIRHVIDPGISYSYAPETNKNKEYQEYTGVGSSSRRQRVMSFSLNNTFQMKFAVGEEEKKFDLFNLNFSSSYDFERDSLQLAPLRTTLTSRAIPLLTVSASSSHNFYYPGSGELHLLSPTLTNISLTASFNKKFRISGGGEDQQEGFEGVDRSADKPLIGGRPDFDFGKSKETSFGVRLNHSYTENRVGGEITRKSNYLESDFALTLTASWRMELNFRYNLEDKRTEFPVFRLARDLNCWAGEFEWRPTGALAGYYFKIYIKQIPDIKVEQSVGGLGGRSYGYY